MGTLTIDVRDLTAASQNDVIIPVINKPNPALGVTATSAEIRALIAMPNYIVTDTGTSTPITGRNFYDYFPEEDPHGGGGDITVMSLSVTKNGKYTAPAGKAYSPVNVNVPSVTAESLNVTTNGTYAAPAGKAYSPVIVNVPIPTLEVFSTSTNGAFTAPAGKAYNTVIVAVPTPTLESLSVSANGTYTPSTGKAFDEVNVNIPSELPTFRQIIERSADADLVIPDGVQSLADEVFSNWSGLTSVKIPKSVTSIGEKSFYFTGLRSITFDQDSSLTSIGNNAFYNTALSTVTLPSSLTSLGSTVFQNCSNLTSAVINGNISSVGSNIFSNL